MTNQQAQQPELTPDQALTALAQAARKARLEYSDHAICDIAVQVLGQMVIAAREAEEKVGLGLPVPDVVPMAGETNEQFEARKAAAEKKPTKRGRRRKADTPAPEEVDI